MTHYQSNQIRAIFDDSTVRVYQAFRPEIALPAIAAQRFVPPFSLSRMTWIKPSFNWMMYRCGFATKAGQEVVLGIDIARDGFEWAISNAAPSHFLGTELCEQEWRTQLENNPVRVQWDPERDVFSNQMKDVRAIQIGLSGEAVQRYVKDWIVRIEDVTAIAKQAQIAASTKRLDRGLPCFFEKPYPEF